MNRTLLLVLGAICWTVAAVDAGLRLVAGDVVVPAVMAIVFVAWTGLRLQQKRRALAPARVTAG
ncbi:MAG: hypothetical protein ABIZ72_00845, partial [Candidatus Limnocylindrales bacterium]